MKKLLLSIAVALTCLSAAAQVRVVGHRGCRFNTPAEPETPLYENTLAALKFAQGLGIYAAEFDVQLTSDGKPIVFHGPVVPGIKKDIHEITFEEARAAKLPGGNRMPTLEEYFRQAKKNRPCPWKAKMNMPMITRTDWPSVRFHIYSSIFRIPSVSLP